LRNQEIPHLLWNPKVHYCAQKGPQPLTITARKGQISMQVLL